MDKYAVLIIESAADQLFIRVTHVGDLRMRAGGTCFRHRRISVLGQEEQSGIEILGWFRAKGSGDKQEAETDNRFAIRLHEIPRRMS
jgi:hypothetical protein